MSRMTAGVLLIIALLALIAYAVSEHERTVNARQQVVLQNG